MKFFRTTNHQKKYWAERKIDWKVSYLDTWNHPHRALLVDILKRYEWMSLIEVGCGPGANLVALVNAIPHIQVGGVDVNADAIKLAEQTFKGGVFKVNSADDIMMSDKSTDVVLADMMYIYVSPRQINKHVKELKRISRKLVVLCEFHSDSWLKRLSLKVRSGYNAYNWPKLLTKHGFEDIIKVKIPPEAWPGGDPQKTYGYIVVARRPKRG